MYELAGGGGGEEGGSDDVLELLSHWVVCQCSSSVPLCVLVTAVDNHVLP